MTSHNRKCLSEDYHQVGQHHNFLGQYHHILHLIENPVFVVSFQILVNRYEG